MKRRIKDIVTDCRETGEIMTFSDFKTCIDGIYYHLRASTLYPDLSPASQNHLRVADNLCTAISDCFDDERDNLVNWFKGEPCRFRHPATGNEVQIKVRMDYEAIYYFLKYCMLLKQHKPISDELFGYLAFILCEPAEV